MGDLGWALLGRYALDNTDACAHTTGTYASMQSGHMHPYYRDADSLYSLSTLLSFDIIHCSLLIIHY